MLTIGINSQYTPIMSLEQDYSASPIKRLHFDLVEQIGVAEALDGRAISFPLPGFLQQLYPAAVAEAEDSSGLLPTGPQASEPAAEQSRQPGIIMTGRLKSKPHEGNLDGRGRPTATATLAAHQEGSDSAQMVFAIFHGATTAVALSLEEDAQITAEGYFHPKTREDRKDSLDVYKLHHYPGKPNRGNAS